MKKLLLVATVLFSGLQAHAMLAGSNYEARHQEAIRSAINKSCHFNGDLVQVASIAEPMRVDQGVIDYHFVTTLEFKVKVDQFIFDRYQASVTSHFFSMYDHEAKAWGAYEVSNVSCSMIQE